MEDLIKKTLQSIEWGLKERNGAVLFHTAITVMQFTLLLFAPGDPVFQVSMLAVSLVCTTILSNREYDAAHKEESE